MHIATDILYAGRMDLNLLHALDVLLEEGSVVGAAKRLHLSQPAMSRTLARLREATGDAIFVRSGRGLIPTPFAEAARAEVHEVVQGGHRLLSPQHAFSPETAERTFTLRCPEVLVTFLTLRLAEPPFSKCAGLRFRFVSESAFGESDLRHSQVDLEINAAKPQSPGLLSREIGRDHLVVASRQTGTSDEGRMTLRQFAAGRHILISRRGKLADAIAPILAAHGLRRRVVMAVPNSASALLLVSQTDFLAVVPERLSRPMLQRFGLQTHPFPEPLQPIPIVLTWHNRVDRDSGHTLLRTTLEQELVS